MTDYDPTLTKEDSVKALRGDFKVVSDAGEDFNSRVEKAIKSAY